MAAVGGISRETRRRRIAERGSDRLALITGQIQSLPSDTVQSAPSADSSQREDTASDSRLPPQYSDKEANQQDILKETVEPLLHYSDKGRDIVSRAVSLLNAEKQFSQVKSSIQMPLLEHQNEQQSQGNSLTTGQICSAITASENIRMYCSVAAAFLVILSYIGFPILGWGVIRGIILFRPLYLLLLTNISIALARLILRAQGKVLRMGRTNTVPTSGGDALVDHVGKALEAGVLLKTISGAFFVDFSIYALVLICGLSLVKGLSW